MHRIETLEPDVFAEVFVMSDDELEDGNIHKVEAGPWAAIGR